MISGHFVSFGQDVTLKTQAAVDAFDPMTTVVNGDLRIGGSPQGSSNITDLTSLSNLINVTGGLVINYNHNLTNIDGLNNLTNIGGGLFLSSNSSLTNVDGFSKLTSITEYLSFAHNAVTNIDGLSNLVHIGQYIVFNGNDNLTNIDALSKISFYLSGVYFHSNDNLINIDGLSNLTSIGDLTIDDNSSLINIDGLENITDVGAEVTIIDNSNLVDCCGIQDLIENQSTTIGGIVTIENNPSECSSEEDVIESICGMNLIVATTPPCIGSDNGIIQVFVEGYDAIPFNYEWIRQDDGLTGNGISETDNFIIDMLGTGTYNLTVTNSTPDIAIKNDIILSQNDGYIFEIIKVKTTNSSNGQSNGSITITTAGGTGPYSYTWSGVTSGIESGVVSDFHTIPLLSYGEYIISVEDDAGASKVVSISLLDETVQVIPCEKPLDILILNDVSGSVDAIEYKESKQFFVDFLQEINLGTGIDESRAALIEWSSSDDQELKIPITGDIATLSTYLDDSRAYDGGTSPHEAMGFGESYLDTNARIDAEKVLILSTDGSGGQLSSSLVALADELKAKGYHIISIAFDGAFSDNTTRDFLRRVASVDALAPGAPAYSQLDADLAKNIVFNYLCPIDPGSSATAYFNRDGAIDIIEIDPIGNCPFPDFVEVTIEISAYRELSIPAGTYVTFYHNNPNQSGAAPILTWQIPCAIPVDSKETYTITLPMDGPSNIFAVFNDDGVQGPPINFPITTIEEIAYSNNIDNERICLDQEATIQALKYSALPIPACDTLVNYTINVCNISEVDAFGITVEDIPPAGFVLAGTIFNDNGCAIDNGGSFDLPADCCLSIILTYDAGSADLGYYGDQDVILGGPSNQTYINFDGSTTTDEDVTLDGTIDCLSTNISFTKTVNIDESCDDGFVEFTFTITNEMNIPLQGLTFTDVLPDPCTWAYIPYGENGLSMANTSVMGEEAIFIIDEVQANTVATFHMDASLNLWSNDGTLSNTATLGNVPDVVNGGFKTLTSNTTSTEITASPQITLPDTIIVNAGLDTVILEAILSTFADVTWTTDGDGLFTDENEESTQYVLGSQDILDGEVMLFISAESSCNETGASVVILFADCSDDEDLEIQLNAENITCENDQVEILVTSNFTLDSISWSGPSNEGLIGDNLLISLPGEYTLIGYSGVCPDTVSIIVNEDSEDIFIMESYTICEGEDILINNEVYNTAGNYQQTLFSINDCDTLLNIELEVLANGMGEETYVIHSGEILVINGIEYDVQGQYIQDLVASNGCDSILIINIHEDEAWITFDFDDCSATIQTMGNADYSEFTPYYNDEPTCGSVTSSNIYREDPFINKHSCTDGLNDSYSMCISSDSNCEFDKNSTKMVRMDIEINPNPNSEVVLTSIEFFQQAPETFDWIDGDDGENNYPTQFGIRILKDGDEIYSNENIPTSLSWVKEEFTFFNNDDFVFTESTTLEIQLLPYCPIGVNSPVSAWDLEDLKVFGSCSAELGSLKIIAGTVDPCSNKILDNVQILLTNDSEPRQVMIDEQGDYAFLSNLEGSSVNISAQKDDDPMEGINSLDLIVLQRHLLGLETFETPLQYIAADLNYDGAVSVLDLIDLRDLILGIYSELPSNDSYRFLNKKDLQKENMAPWDISENIEFQNLSNHILDADFVPVKIGDITNNGQSQNNSAISSLELEELNKEPILVKKGIVVKESKTSIKFDLSDPRPINGYQYQINIKDSKLISIESKLDNFNEDNYNVTDDGMLIISWINAQNNGVVASNLFTLHFDEKYHENFLQEEIVSEVYINNEAYPLKSIKSLPFQSMGYISNLVIYPNPVDNETIISFAQNAKSIVDFCVLNIEGKVVYKDVFITKKGENSFRFPISVIQNQSGLFIVRLTNNGNSMTKKIMIAN